MMKIGMMLVVLLALVGGGWYGWTRLKREPEALAWRTRVIERGTVVQEVRATGEVQPVKTVEVGTQVNGIIQKLFVDFNTQVKAGQLVAQIDPAVYEANVAKDEAQLASNLATVEQIETKLALAEKELGRMAELVARNMVSQANYDTALAERDTLRAQLKVAKASVEQSRASTKLSRTNLGYTTIRSPVDGVVIDRNVDEGQTVVSSMNAQKLFQIATDLARIQVEAAIPEADVGDIRPGQTVTFNVDAYKTVFTGEVVQVRMAATSVQNVVTYPVIVEADNPGQKLFPGMTANLAIETGRAEAVLKVPAAALRFNPDSGEERVGADMSSTRSSGSRIWLADTNGVPRQTRVTAGLSDGAWVAVQSTEPIEGQSVIIGMAPTVQAEVNNPFAPKFPGGATRRAMR